MGSEFSHSDLTLRPVGLKLCAFVAETLSEMESRSLAFWDGSDVGDGFTYRFPGALPAGRGGSHLRDFIRLAGEIP